MANRQIIKQQIAQSLVVGADETGAKVNGTKWWIWTVRRAVWQNLLNSFIVPSDNRDDPPLRFSNDK